MIWNITHKKRGTSETEALVGNNSKKNKINWGGGGGWEGRNAAFMQNIWHFGKGNAMCFEFHSQMVCVKPFKKKKTTKCRDEQNEFTLLVKRAVCCISPSAQLNWPVQHQ